MGDGTFNRFKGVIAEQVDDNFDSKDFLDFADEVGGRLTQVQEALGYTLSNPKVSGQRDRIIRELFEWVAREPGGASLVTDGMITTICERLLPKPKVH